MSASFNKPIVVSYTANSDLSALQYTFVKMVSTGLVDAVAAATDIPVGVLLNMPKAGQEAEVVVLGGTKVKASAAITLPALIGTTATGTAVKLAAGTDTTKYILGQAEGVQGIAGAAGDLITVFVNCATPSRAA